MELLYIWIENYKNIENQGFNFSPLHNFEFTPTVDENGKVVSGTLIDRKTEEQRKELEQVYKGFFGKNITNVTAIIGENGSGKTSIQEILIHTLMKDIIENYTAISTEVSPVANQSYFFVYSDENKMIKIWGNKIEVKYDETIQEEKPKLNYSLIYFSPFFTYNDFPDAYYQKPFNPIINMIDNWGIYVNTSHGAYVLWEKKHELVIMGSRLRTDLTSYFYYDDLLQIIFLGKNFLLENTEERKYISIPFADQVYFDCSVNWVTVDDKVVKVYDEILDKLYEKLHPDTDIDFIRLEWIASIMVTYCTTSPKGVSLKFNQAPPDQIPPHNIIDEFLKIVEGKDMATIFDGAIDFISDQKLFPHYEDKKIAQFEKFKVKETINLLNYVKENIISQNIKFYQDRPSPLSNYQDKKKIGRYFSPNKYELLVSVGKDLVIRFLEHCQAETYPFLGIDFPRFSSGEKLFLSQFARYYQVSQKPIYDNLIFLIDEGEIGMHPQWQKEYLNRLLTTLPKIFKDKNIQIILTSHSPFLVSDLPKENIIFLEKGENGKCKVSKLQDRKETFGANIHTLFTDSFFMSGGLIGEFAKGKIQKTLQWLNEDGKEDADHHKKIIEMLGEPIIKQKLLDMYNAKMGIDAELERLKQQKELLDKKIRDLETKKIAKK